MNYSLSSIIEGASQVSNWTVFWKKTSDLLYPCDNGSERIGGKHEMNLTFAYQLPRNMLIGSKSLHNKLERLFSTRCKYNHIICKAKVIDLKTSHLHEETMIQRVRFKSVHEIGKNFSPQNEKRMRERISLFQASS